MEERAARIAPTPPDRISVLLAALNAHQLTVLHEAFFAGCVRARTSSWGKPDEEGVAKLALMRGLHALGLLEFVETTGDEWSALRDAVHCYILSEDGADLIQRCVGARRPARAVGI